LLRRMRMRGGVAIGFAFALAACGAPAVEENQPRDNDMVELPLPSGPPLAQPEGPETRPAKSEKPIADGEAKD
jgi:hypothetical protein